MMIALSKELQEAVRASQGQPIRIVDPETQAEYVVISAELYDRIGGLLYEDDPLTKGERKSILIQAGLRAGWDDPAMDVYNDLKSYTS